MIDDRIEIQSFLQQIALLNRNKTELNLKGINTNLTGSFVLFVLFCFLISMTQGPGFQII